MYGDAHGIGNLLDPRYIGDGMNYVHEDDPMPFKEMVETFMYKYPIEHEDESPQEVQENIFQEYTAYQIDAINNSIFL